ncbi:TonB-dependent receptor [soil metagenome]
MKKFELFAASAIALVAANPAFAQTAPAPQETESSGFEDVVVTAQRQSERLQDVPIAVTAFTAAALDRQQIVNSTSLQLTLPNVTFTKTNFTSSSFTIRGIGDLCVGVTCDSATAIHTNDMPLLSSRLFENEFYDMERIEVLRGPQGTLFGRNATAGVVNLISSKPDLSGIHASAEGEYGNYDSKKVKGMFNLPLGDTLGIRVAGLYLKRDGYTYNQYTKNNIDDRDLYSVRGTLSWEPSPDTRIDLIGYYFHENDHRSRVQKQLCHRDPTGVLGCLPDRLGNDVVNANSQLTTLFSSTQLINISLAQAGAAALIPLFAPLTTGSIYAPDGYANATNPTDPRVVNTDFDPNYFTEEQQYTAKFFHDFGPVAFNFTGGYAKNEVVSQAAYNFGVPVFPVSALNTLNAYATPGVLTGANAALTSAFAAYRNALIPNGPTGGLCVSDTDPQNVGVFGGHTLGCYSTAKAYDESSQKVEQYSLEAHFDSHLDGPFNFLVGGIYFDSKTHNNSYYVNAFPLDYTAFLLGAIQTVGARFQQLGAGQTPNYPAVFRASPFYRSNTDYFRLKSYGLFGETYYQVADSVKITLGLRYNHDDKFVHARTSLFNDANGNAVLVPVGSTDISQALNYSTADYDALTAGVQPYADGRVQFSRLTGRAVIDYKITRDNLVYLSYSRGYKSGGINPPLSAVFAVPSTFDPESVNAYEIGSKNSFGNGALRLNVTGFYYDYKNLQLSRIVSRTSVNDNVSAHIYGLEAEAVLSPVRAFVVNMNASVMQSKVSEDKLLADTRDPSAGRSDAVIIKDLSTSANCALQSNAGSAALANAYVGAINGGLGLNAPVAVPGTNTTGAYSICSVLQSNITAPSAALRTAFGTPTGALPFTVYNTGIPTNIRGNKLPGAPTYKFSVGAQYTIDGGSWNLVPRVDLAYTGNSYGSVFNTNEDRIQGYAVINAQIQFNGADDRFFVRGFVQNLGNNNAITGQYVGDQSSGLYTNIFTLEPRRYGVAAGFKF